MRFERTCVLVPLKRLAERLGQPMSKPERCVTFGSGVVPVGTHLPFPPAIFCKRSHPERRITTPEGQAIAASGPTRTSLTGVQTPSTLGPGVTQSEEARKRNSSELHRGNEADETGQVRVNLHGSHNQQ